MDYVSEEAANAGKYAARKCLNKGGAQSTDTEITNVVTGNGVRYTVPVTIRSSFAEDEITIRFRVGNVYKDCYVEVYADEERILRRKRPVVAPGEMENVTVKKSSLEGGVKELKVLIAGQ